MSLQSNPEKELHPYQKLAVNLLMEFFVLNKIFKIYEPNNILCQERARTFFEQLKSILDTDGTAEFAIRHSAIYFNKLRLKFTLHTYPVFKSVLIEFKKRNISLLRFLPGIEYDELVAFTRAFSLIDVKEANPFSRLVKEMFNLNISNVELEKSIITETFTASEYDAARIYFLSIVHLKESSELERKNKPLKISTTRRLVQSLYNHIVDNESFILGLTTLKNYDEYTLNHSVNVCALAMALGRRLGLSRSELVELGIAAFFHDLGKLDTPLEILNKPGQLNKDERVIIEKHPFQGAEKLVHLKDFRGLPLRSIHVAMEHHIKEDLTGYPRYYKKESVNLFSKIVKIVDYFDAITTPRVYRKKPMSRLDSMNHMLELSGKEFNPLILKVFVNMIGTIPIGSLVALNTGELGLVVDINPEVKLMNRPKIKLITDADGNKIDGEIIDLAEKIPETNKYKKAIAAVLDPDKYKVNVSDYFLAMAKQ